MRVNYCEALLAAVSSVVVHQFGYQRMMLIGILVRNPQTVHFFKRIAFAKLGGFDEGTGRASYDMILSLD